MGHKIYGPFQLFLSHYNASYLAKVHSVKHRVLSSMQEIERGKIKLMLFRVSSVRGDFGINISKRKESFS